METAFKVLRSAGYAAHALSVAERAGQPEWILDVLLEDMASYAEAVAFIGEFGGRGGMRESRRGRGGQNGHVMGLSKGDDGAVCGTGPVDQAPYNVLHRNMAIMQRAANYVSCCVSYNCVPCRHVVAAAEGARPAALRQAPDFRST